MKYLHRYWDFFPANRRMHEEHEHLCNNTSQTNFFIKKLIIKSKPEVTLVHKNIQRKYTNLYKIILNIHMRQNKFKI